MCVRDTDLTVHGVHPRSDWWCASDVRVPLVSTEPRGCRWDAACHNPHPALHPLRFPTPLRLSKEFVQLNIFKYIFCEFDNFIYFYLRAFPGFIYHFEEIDCFYVTYCTWMSKARLHVLSTSQFFWAAPLIFLSLNVNNTIWLHWTKSSFLWKLFARYSRVLVVTELVVSGILCTHCSSVSTNLTRICWIWLVWPETVEIPPFPRPPVSLSLLRLCPSPSIYRSSLCSRRFLPLIKQNWYTYNRICLRAHSHQAKELGN